MDDNTKDKNIKGNNSKIAQNEPSQEISYINYYTLDLRYELLSPIIKDIQIIAQLIKFIKKHQLSDLIFIKGNNTYSIESRFYFNYRNIIDFYVKVIDFIETDYFTKIKYYIYKTKPSSKGFYLNITLFYNDENSSKLTTEIILFNNATLNKKILNIIFSELNQNFVFLIKAIKSNKLNSFSFCSSIIKNEFFVLTQIIQNKKLIEYIINGRFKKFLNEKSKELDLNNNSSHNSSFNSVNSNKSDKEKHFIKLGEIYTINLKKKPDLNEWISSNNISFKIQLIKIREDNLLLQFKIIFNNNDKETLNDSNSIYNIVSIYIRKLTNNSSFIYMKWTWDNELDVHLINSIKIFCQKCLHNIEKLSKTTKQC